ncbi:MAG: hypothetical protein ACAI44_31110, partial [Candidatus Sericytochromatia bacterium]
MSEIHLNAQTFETFKRVSANHEITKSEALELKQAILADGQVDADEAKLLDQLTEHRGDSSLSVTVAGGAQQLKFKPNQMHFENADAKSPLTELQAHAPAGTLLQAHSLAELKTQLAQKPPNLALIVNTLNDRNLRKEAISGLVGLLEQMGEAEQTQSLLDMNKNRSGLTSKAANEGVNDL